MHGRIFQISSQPINEEDFVSSDYFYDNSSDFADYIGDEIEGEEREEEIKDFADLLSDVFTLKGNNVLEFRGTDALNDFLKVWVDKIKSAALDLNTDNILRLSTLYNIRSLTKHTHLASYYRVAIEDDDYTSPLADLFINVVDGLKEGDCLYIGAVIDYHY